MKINISVKSSFRWIYCLLFIVIFVSSSAFANKTKQKMLAGNDDYTHTGRPLLGVIRWDMYSGKGPTQKQELGYLPGEQGFLKPQEWHYRAPFFCRRTVDVDWIQHPVDAGPLWFNHPFDQEVLKTAMDEEIDFATDAGVDFFIFNGPTRTLYANGWELHNNLDVYLQNSREDKIKFVFTLYGHHAIDYGRSKVDLMLDEIISYMQLPSWQKVKENRPLLPVLWPIQFKEMLESQIEPSERMSLSEFVAHIRTRVMAVGLENPYIVAQEINHSYTHATLFWSAGFDAIADYQGGYGGATKLRDQGPTYASATETILSEYNESFLPSMNFIPTMAIGMYAWPRANAEKWYHYRNPLPGDIADRLERIFTFVEEHPEKCDAQVVFMYAWNEHSEGGALCPTMGTSPDYIPVTNQLDEVRNVLKTITVNYGAKGASSIIDFLSLVYDNNSITIRGLHYSAKVKIFDLQGKLLTTFIATDAIPTPLHMEPGVYIVNVELNSANKIFKMIIS